MAFTNDTAPSRHPGKCCGEINLNCIYFHFRFHAYNSNRESSTLAGNDAEDETFARPAADSRSPRGWLVDLIQQFGKHGGFVTLKERFTSTTAPALTVPIIFSLLRPFGQCCEFLTQHTISEYLLPCIVSYHLFISS